MTERELVSVVIPTYNRGNLLKDSIKSVLRQTYKNFELIIVDDGSTDNTKDIIQSCKDPRVKYIIIEHSGLSPRVRNTGIKAAKGKYIALLDSDDLWLRNKLEIQMKKFEIYPDVLVIATNHIYFSDKKKYIDSIYFPEDTKVTYREMLRMCKINNSSVIIKKEVFDMIGYKDEKCRLMSDYDFWLRLLNYKDNSLLILKDILVKTRLHESNTFFRSKDFIEKYQTWKVIYYKHIDYDPNYIKNNLKWRLLKNHFEEMRMAVFLRKIRINKFLSDRKIKFNEKLQVFLEYCYLIYVRKSNLLIDLLRRVFHYYIFQLLKGQEGK